jgi:hypothetical protein
VHCVVLIIKKTGHRTFAKKLGYQVTHKVTFDPDWVGKDVKDELSSLKKVMPLKTPPAVED